MAENVNFLFLDIAFIASRVSVLAGVLEINK